VSVITGEGGLEGESRVLGVLSMFPTDQPSTSRLSLRRSITKAHSPTVFSASSPDPRLHHVPEHLVAGPLLGDIVAKLPSKKSLEVQQISRGLGVAKLAIMSTLDRNVRKSKAKIGATPDVEILACRVQLV
jgi:hypothetical protein